MRCILSAMFVTLTLGPAAAMAQNTPVDVKNLPAQISGLKWKEVDLSTLTPLEKCRSLGLLNELLDDIIAQLTAEADLMSEFIDDKDLGAEFVGEEPVEEPAVLTVTDGLKVAVALLRGPMADSSYATQFADYEPNVLAATTTLFTSGCQSKWSVMADNRLRVRCMAKFLKTQGKLDEYKAWAPAAAERHAKELEAEESQRRAALAADQQQKAKEQKERRQQIEQQQQAAREMRRALAAEQQNQAPSTPQQSSQQHGYVGDGYYSDAYYGGGIWYRNGAYLGAAAARTDARYAGWRGKAGRGGGGGRGGRR